MSQRPSVCWGLGANFTWAILGEKNLPHQVVLSPVFRHPKFTVSKKVMTMSSCLEKGEGSSSKLWSPLLQSKALFLKCWRLRYFLLKHSRCVNYHSIQMKFRPDVGFLLKLQHKGQLVFVYLTGVESFVNSEESVPLSFTGKTTQLLLSKKLQGGLVCQNHSFSRIITPRNPTY